MRSRRTQSVGSLKQDKQDWSGNRDASASSMAELWLQAYYQWIVVVDYAVRFSISAMRWGMVCILRNYK